MNPPDARPGHWAALVKLTAAQDRQWAALRLWLESVPAASPPPRPPAPAPAPAPVAPPGRTVVGPR